MMKILGWPILKTSKGMSLILRWSILRSRRSMIVKLGKSSES